MKQIEELVQLLVDALDQGERRAASVHRFQNLVFDAKVLETSPEVSRLLRDLAYDLSFFVANPAHRKEDPSYYGYQRLESEIGQALHQLRNLGITIPDRQV